MTVNRIRRKMKVMLTALLAALLLCACGSGKSAVMESTVESSGAAYDSSNLYDTAPEEAPAEEMDGGGSDIALPADSNRKLVKTVDMNLETEGFDGLVENIGNRAAEAGGYVEQSDVSGRSYGDITANRYASMTVRVPADRLDGFLASVTEGANVVSKQERVEDITLQYVDTESHKKALAVEQERLLALLDQAEDLDSIVILESRLSEVRYELQNYESALRGMDNRVDYATVYLYIQEVERYTPQVEKTAVSRITTGFSENVYVIMRGIKNFAIEFVIFTPFLLLLAFIALIIFLIVHLILKADRKHQQKRAQKREQQMKQREQQMGQQPLVDPPAPKASDGKEKDALYFDHTADTQGEAGEKKEE